MAIAFHPVRTDEEIEKLARVADEIWHEYWPALIGKAQTDYMVEQFQSIKVIRHDMSVHAYEYWFIEDEQGGILGYTGGHVEPETNRFFISKIYLYEEARGHGYARRTVEFYDELCRERGLSAMYLTVNKRNELGTRAYRGTGFEVIESVETDIGEGFVMDDYIMERKVSLA